MRNYVACLHPAEHGVTSHIASSRIAQKCAHGASSPSRSLRVPLPTYSALEHPGDTITHYDMHIEQVDFDMFTVTTSFQLTADDEEMAYELAESTFPHIKDSGISATRIEGDEWDVVSRFVVTLPTHEAVLKYAQEQFIGLPSWKSRPDDDTSE